MPTSFSISWTLLVHWQACSKEFVIKNYFLIFLPKHVVGTQKNRHTETVRLSTQNNMFKLMGKKVIIILHGIFVFLDLSPLVSLQTKFLLMGLIFQW